MVHGDSGANGRRTDGITVAVVEDDAELREMILVPMLARAGFNAAGMASALDLYRAMTRGRHDLVVLDVGLPDDDGISITRHLRSLSSTIGIVMMTGLDSAHMRLRSLQAGADVYLPKPIDLDELVAVLNNLARRCIAGKQEDWIGKPGGWRLSTNGWRLQTPAGDLIVLTLPEREMVRALVAAGGQPVARDVLISRLADDDLEFDPHRLEMLVYRLRQKCSQASAVELPLKALRGRGYLMVM